MKTIRLTVRIEEESYFKLKRNLAEVSLKTREQTSVANWINEQIKKAVK